MLCPNCNEPLIEIEFKDGFQIVCDNWRCYLYRQPQRNRLKEPEAVTIGSYYRPKAGPTYEAYKEHRKENYRVLVGLGISPIEARNMASDKQTRFALQKRNTKGM
jgi:hypothetical protein